MYTAISIDVVGSKVKTTCTRQDCIGYVGSFMNTFIKISRMPRPFSEDLQWQGIWMKEMLGYQVDDVAAALRMSLSLKL